MAKIRLDLDDLTVESFEVSGAVGRGTVHGHSGTVDEIEQLEYASYSCEGTCKSCATGPCDAMCTGPKSCMCDLIGGDPGMANNFGM